MMNVQTVAVLMTCVFTVGGVLIYIGRSLGKLESIGAAVAVALAKTDRHDADIARMDKDLTEVKTRQKDCSNCP